MSHSLRSQETNRRAGITSTGSVQMSPHLIGRIFSDRIFSLTSDTINHVVYAFFETDYARVGCVMVTGMSLIRISLIFLADLPNFH